MNLNQVTVPALDVTASVAFYKRLGLELIVSSPHYARFKCPEGEATFSVQESLSDVRLAPVQSGEPVRTLAIDRSTDILDGEFWSYEHDVVNKSLQPTRVGVLSSASRFTPFGPAWLSSSRWADRSPAHPWPQKRSP